MNTLLKAPAFALLLNAVALPAIAGDAKVLTVDLEEGQLLSLVVPRSRADAEAARKAYYDAAFPLADQYGLTREGQLRITEKVVGNYEPEGVILFSWPDAASEAALTDRAEWPGIKAKRPAGWEDLKIYTDVLQEDVQLSFDPGKYYTLAFAWFSADEPGGYPRYMAGIAPAVTRAGGRIMYEMMAPAFESHASGGEGPGQVTFVEWDSKEGFGKMIASPEYQENRADFGAGVSQFEFYRVAPAG